VYDLERQIVSASARIGPIALFKGGGGGGGVCWTRETAIPNGNVITVCLFVSFAQSPVKNEYCTFDSPI